MAKKILITGGAGFIGSHLVRTVLREADVEVVNVDKLTYAANLENLSDVENDSRYKFIQADVSDSPTMEKIFSENKFDAVMHLAAETHVDNSIENSSPFLQTNVMGTHTLLELSRKTEVKKFLYVSTDEVYGDLEIESTEKFTEISPLKPSSPYSSSKAAGDMLALSYHRTYDMQVVISRCSNNYGTHQYHEKLIPFFTKKIGGGEKAPLYGDGKNVREWIHVEDHAEALLFLLEKGKAGEVYNVGSGEEKSNREILENLCKVLNKKTDESFEFVKDRAGHDKRYALDSSKINKLGWKASRNFENSFPEIINWYLQKK